MEFFADSLAGFQVDPAQGTPVAADAGANELLLSLNGVEYAIPDPEGLDSASFANEEGMTIVSDLDGDGRIDYVSSVSFDGHWAAWRPESSELRADETGNPPQSGQEKSSDSGVFSKTTPERVERMWSAQRWECVERGHWG